MRQLRVPLRRFTSVRLDGDFLIMILVLVQDENAFRMRLMACGPIVIKMICTRLFSSVMPTWTWNPTKKLQRSKLLAERHPVVGVSESRTIVPIVLALRLDCIAAYSQMALTL